MRYIQKAAEPQVFSDWKALANEDWQPSYDVLPGNIKKAVYRSLLVEQGYICCYCERELVEGDYHIEHLNPQHLHTGDGLNYSNFLCSCLNKTVKGEPLHCGKLKDDPENCRKLRDIDILKVHPLQEDCSSHFSFSGIGEIKGETDSGTQTIKRLGLDIKKLNDMRKEALEPFLDPISDTEFLEFVEGYLKPSATGRLNPFQTMITCLFGGI